MTFRYEQEMVEPTINWLRGQGLMVKHEFPTPWGICDLVGCSLNQKKVNRRLSLNQKKPVGSQFRIQLLSLIPDENQKRSVSFSELKAYYGEYIDMPRIKQELAKLMKDHFVREASPGTFYKQNGWLPLHKRLIAVELKLSRIEEACCQAINNLGFADESFIGIPAPKAYSLVNSRRRDDFINKGIGIIGVNAESCRIVLKARRKNTSHEQVVRSYATERFWQDHLKGIHP
ncbi:MAG: hypothetical protein MI922_10185 [Bacteroidales bacterium]|nr:hypothetical protein [Bacteroidales bacterium]